MILAQLRLDTASELRSRFQVEIEDSHCPYSEDLGRLIWFYRLSLAGRSWQHRRTGQCYKRRVHKTFVFRNQGVG